MYIYIYISDFTRVIRKLRLDFYFWTLYAFTEICCTSQDFA